MMSLRPRANSVLMVEAHGGSGGPPTTLLDLAPELSKRRHVTVAIPPGRIADELALRAPDIRIETLPRWAPHRRTVQRLRSFPQLFQEIGRHAIIHANGKSALNLLAPALLSRSWRRAVFVHFHDSELTDQTARVLRVWSRLGIGTHYAPVSNVGGEVLRKAGLQSIEPVLGNPVPPATALASFGSPPFDIAYVGSRNPVKGLDLMVEVAALLRSEPVTWSVYGVVTSGDPGEFTSSCLRRADELGLGGRIRWLGRQPDLQTKLAKHHCLLMTSRRESFSRVVLEGMAAGLPVVASAVPGVLEAAGEENCLAFQLDDLAVAADGIRRLVRDRHLYRTLQQAGLSRAGVFAPEAVCDALEEAYERLERGDE